MKRILILLGIILIAITGYSQNKRIYELTNQATANASYYVVVDNNGWASSRKMTIDVLTELEESARVSQDDTIEKYTGLETDGTWDAPNGANYINDAGFAAIGLSETISNAAYILDSIIAAGVRWEDGTGSQAVCLKSSADSASAAQAVAIGNITEANHAASFTHGKYSQSAWYAGRYYASSAVHELQLGSSQGFEICMSTNTSTTTADTLNFGNTPGSYMDIPNDAVVLFEIKLVGVVSSSGGGYNVGDLYAVNYQGVIKNVGGTTSFVGVPDKIIEEGDAGVAAMSVTLDANDTDDALHILVTGLATTTINWSATIEGNMTGFRNFDIDN